jgi:hypothetical protein
LGTEIYDWEIPKTLKTWGNGAAVGNLGIFMFLPQIDPIFQLFWYDLLS